MKLEKYTFKITGISALLQNNPERSMVRAAPGVARKTIPTAEEEAALKTYRVGKEGTQLYVPAHAFRAALLDACKGKRIGKVGAASVVSGAVLNVGPMCLMTNAAGKKVTKYQIDTRRAVVQKQGVLRSRPIIKDWACMVDFEIDVELIDPEWIASLLNEAGKLIGVGDFRPSKRGWFGRFEAELVTAKKKKASRAAS